MIIETIKDNSDIKKLSFQELNILAKELRQIILDTVLTNGGHLASNLGNVELTIALHYVFNFKKDKLIFDVGHQCYAHKLLTNRYENFNTLRKLNGISGFPKMDESEYDHANTGHASTSVSLGCGFCYGQAHNKTYNHVISVLGDGALTGGLVHEALNTLKNLPQKQIVILNDNRMSISQSVGGYAKALSNVHVNKNYIAFKNKISTFFKEINLSKKYRVSRQIKFLKKVRRIGKIVLNSGLPFEAYNVSYFGNVDGHNIKLLVELLEKLKHSKKSLVLHIITKKGKGFKLAEINPSKFHGYSPNSSKKKSFSQVLGEQLSNIINKDKNVFVITAAMPDGTGTSIVKRNFPKNFIDVNIAESHAVCISSTLCMENIRPYICIYSTFLTRAVDQIIHDVILQKQNPVFCVDRAGLIAGDGETHQGIFDVNTFKIFDNIDILSPTTNKELLNSLLYAKTNNKITVIRYEKTHEYIRENYKHDHEMIPGKWIKYVFNDSKITIIASGSRMLKSAYEVSLKFKKEDINIDVIQAKSIKPLDEKLLLDLKDKTIYVMEENFKNTGIASLIKDFYYKYNKTNIYELSIDSPFIPCASIKELLSMFKLDSDSVYEIIKQKEKL